MIITNDNLTETLNKLFKASGLNRNQMAKLMGVNCIQVSNMLKGRYKAPRLTTLFKFLQACGASLKVEVE